MRRPLALAAVAALALTLAGAAATRPTNGGRGGITYAIVGDVPYGPTELGLFPGLVQAINADPDVELTIHLGDIKNGSSLCSDEYFAQIRHDVDAFADPFVLTPGDNEWTDCHRPAAGGYVPTERLAKLRRVFYPRPRQSLGRHPKTVESQAEAGFVENRLWKASKVVFSTVHVVGSNNDLQPWFGTAETAEQRTERLSEYGARLTASLAWIDRTFDRAESESARGVVVAMQADMWAGSADGFREIVQRLATRAAAFAKPVLLLEGDSHVYLVDRPLATGSPLHGVTTAAPNLTRLVVDGETAVDEYLRLRVDPQAPQLFTWERVFLP
jgi:hypothetical protein